MKRLILSAVLGVAALGLSTEMAQAGPFCCWGCNKCGKCGANFCVRQYNAFSPVCSGTIYCDGICPIGGYGIPGGFNPYCASCGAGGAGYYDGGGAMASPQMLPADASPTSPATGAPPVAKPLQVPQHFPPPTALPMPQAGPAAVGMQYPYYPRMMNAPVMPAGYGQYPGYGYPQAYGYPQGYGYPQMAPMMGQQ
jgi:hypothetical protein